ncbi:MAG: hypothetical protein GYA14_15835 [Ignavibacteria bacterium]|nr:hypothetical protein [Ignavibacteria bacterium]
MNFISRVSGRNRIKCETKIIEAMEIDKDYMRFKRWFKEAEKGFYCGQYSDEQIAYAAWCEGRKHPKEEQTPVKMASHIQFCKCIGYRNVYSFDRVIYCAICGKPIGNGTLLG